MTSFTDKLAGLALPVDEPGRMSIVHPVTGARLMDAEGREAYLDLLSLDSRKAQALGRARLTEAMRRKASPAKSGEEIDAEAVAELAALTVGWHLVGLEGEAIDVPFSQSAARELYGEPSMLWLREQALLFQGDRANFCKASSTN